MIIATYGKPRSGKSYETVAFQIIPALRSGRKVITNIPLNIDRFNLVFGADFIKEHLEIRTKSIGLVTKKILENGRKKTVQVVGRPFESLECYADDWRNERGVGALIIIDECHFVLPRGQTPLPISQWFSMHGHAGFDIILLTQNFRKVDLDIRDMVEVVFYVTKMTTFGEPDKYIRKVKDGFAGAWDVDNQEIREYEPKYYPYYISHTMSEMAVTEETAKDIKGHKGIFQKKGMLFIILMMFVSSSVIAYKLGFAEDEPTAPKVSVVKDSKPVLPVKKPILNDDVLNDSANSINALSNVASTAPVPLPPVGHELEINTHPYYKVQLHIKGVVTFDGSLSYLFDATNNGYRAFTIVTADLIKAGYVITPMGDCLAEISYKKVYSDFLVCDSSQITGSFASN